MTNVIKEFLESDERKVEKLIAEYPVSIPTAEAAKFLGINNASMRAVIDSGSLGLSWRKEGALNKGFFIPTASFIRWYLRYGDQG
ncbi:MAG: hypothetical protein IIZ78_11505 [Clostridiales bacterium]|nr:hypothetical protein [Clostridiales bacterium]MEE0874263.1 hypothetical protein [Ruminococcus sp.]